MADLKRTVASNKYDTTVILSKVIPTLEKKFVLADLASPASLSANVGSTARWLKDSNFDPADLDGTDSAYNALTDDSGTPITFATRDTFNETTFTGTSVEAQIHTYSVFVPVRKPDMDQMPASLSERLSARLAYAGREVWDTLLRAQADGSGTSFNPSMGAGSTNSRKSIGNGTNDTTLAADDQLTAEDIGDGTNDTTLSATDYLTAEDIALVVNDLRQKDAEPFSGGKMAIVIHSGAEGHVITDVSSSRLTWHDSVKYVGGASGQSKIMDGQIGSLAGGDVIVSNNITTSTVDTRSAYNNLAIADWGLGTLSMGDAKPRVFINDQPSVADPHRFYKTYAFQFEMAPKLLDADRVFILYSTV